MTDCAADRPARYEKRDGSSDERRSRLHARAQAAVPASEPALGALRRFAPDRSRHSHRVHRGGSLGRPMSNRELPMMPWYPDQFAASTRAMRYGERVAYRELLDVQWQLGVLPDDAERLAVAIGCPHDEFAKVWPSIRHKFIAVEGGLQNFRLEQHRLAAVKRKRGQQSAASSTNAKRYGERVGERIANRDGERVGERDAQRSLSESLTASPPSPSPSPTSKTPQPPAKQGAAAVNGHGKRTKGTNPRARESNPRAIAESEADAARWAPLRGRAENIGFREPRSDESLEVYDTQLRLAEHEKGIYR